MVDTAAPRMDVLGDLRKRVQRFGPLVGGSLVLLLIVWLAINLAKTPADLRQGVPDRHHQRLGLRAGRPRLHARLRHPRADQLRPRRRVHARRDDVGDAHGERLQLGLGAQPGSLWPALLRSLRDRDGRSAGCSTRRVERIAYRPLRNAPRLAPLITAIAMSFILQNVGIVWKGAELRLAAGRHPAPR